VLAALSLPGCAPGVVNLRPAPPFAAIVGPLIVAHRGGAGEAPENTLAALRHAVASGADWAEIDVALTADEAVVLMHDDTLDRTTDGYGSIARASLAALLKLNAGGGERVATLGEALAIPDMRLMIELKGGGRRLVDKVIEAVHGAYAADRVALASFDRTLLEAVYQRDPSLSLIGIVDSAAAVDLALELPLSVVAVRLDLVDAALTLIPARVALWAWTAASVAEAESLAERGVHGIITDVPAAVVAALRTPPPARLPLSQ